MSLFGRLLGRAPVPPTPPAPVPVVEPVAPVVVAAVAAPVLAPMMVAPMMVAPPAVTIAIEYDVAPHFARVLALLQGPETLNYTKTAMRRNLARSEAELRNLLTRPMVQAGLVRVHVGERDLGYCGLYVLRSEGGRRRLVHYCFAPEVADLGVETWLYRRLGRPDIDIRGDVVVDIIGGTPDLQRIVSPQPPAAIGTVYARGSNDLLAMLHYFDMLGCATKCDVSMERGGVMLPLHHSIIARYAMDGLDPAALDALAPVGFMESDFQSVLTAPGMGARAVWLLSFGSDAQIPLCEHRSTGILVPARIPDAPEDEAAETPEQWERRRVLRQSFEQIGLIDEKPFKENLAALLRRALPDTCIFIFLLNEKRHVADAKGDTVIARHKQVNNWTCEVAADYPNVALPRMADFAVRPSEIGKFNHFDRMVYVRAFQHVVAACGGAV